jgi:hypothetical protein
MDQQEEENHLYMIAIWISQGLSVLPDSYFPSENNCATMNYSQVINVGTATNDPDSGHHSFH